MRVNVYAEEMTDRIEIIEKTIDGQIFRAVRFYLYLPVTEFPKPSLPPDGEPPTQHRGPFLHREGDDDSAAVTFWGKHDLENVLEKALQMLRERYPKGHPSA